MGLFGSTQYAGPFYQKRAKVPVAFPQGNFHKYLI